MKRALAIILLCLISLTGCGGQRSANPKTNREAKAVNTPNTLENSTSASGARPADGSTARNTSPHVPASSDMIEIKEKMFIAQSNDIYLNPEDYLGKTIKYEGIFDSYYSVEDGITYYYVFRYGPGCCDFDANAGFEVMWSGAYPDKNDWVEVVGILEEHEEDGERYLILNLSSLTVLDTRGAEYVYQ